MAGKIDGTIEQPGKTGAMERKPKIDNTMYKPAGKLENKVAIITGGDSGIGAATAICFSKERARGIAIVYKDEHEDAKATKKLVEQYGAVCTLIHGDIGDPKFCADVITNVASMYGGIDILVNNAGEQHAAESAEDISNEQLERTFRTNIFSMFYLVREALPHMKQGGAIINTASVTAYRGQEVLLDYSSSKGAIVTFTRTLSQQLAQKGIRVNAVAPGPIWTPLIPASFPKDKQDSFGKETPMGRAGEAYEVAPSYVFLASDDASYITGQVIHPNGGDMVES